MTVKPHSIDADQDSQNMSSPEGTNDAGELPHGWSEQRIESLFAPLADGRMLHQGWSPQCDKVPSPSENFWGVLKTTAVQAGEFQPEHNKLLPSSMEARPLIEVKEGDILITCAGPRVRCGVSCLVRHTRKRLMMSGKMYRFRVDVDRADPRYVEAFLQTERARVVIDKMKTGTSDSGLNLTHDRFRKLLIPVAPLPEQRRIVAEIEKQFTRLQAGVAALRCVQANLKRYRAAVLKSACEGRLVPTEAALRKTGNRKSKLETGDALLARILNERRQNWRGRGQYKEPVAPDTCLLPAIPEGWTWARAEQLCGFITKGTTPSAENMQPGTGEVRFIKVYNLTFTGGLNSDYKPVFISRKTHEVDLARSEVRPADILINIVGPPLGQVSIVPTTIREANINQAIARFRVVLPECGKLLAIWLMAEPIISWAVQRAKTTAGQSNLTLEHCRDLPIPLPPLDEQARIVAEVERRLSVVEELEGVVSANLHRAIRLRQSILQKAFTGKL